MAKPGSRSERGAERSDPSRSYVQAWYRHCSVSRRPSPSQTSEPRCRRTLRKARSTSRPGRAVPERLRHERPRTGRARRAGHGARRIASAAGRRAPARSPARPGRRTSSRAVSVGSLRPHAASVTLRSSGNGPAARPTRRSNRSRPPRARAGGAERRLRQAEERSVQADRLARIVLPRRADQEHADHGEDEGPRRVSDRAGYVDDTSRRARLRRVAASRHAACAERRRPIRSLPRGSRCPPPRRAHGPAASRGCRARLLLVRAGPMSERHRPREPGEPRVPQGERRVPGALHEPLGTVTCVFAVTDRLGQPPDLCAAKPSMSSTSNPWLSGCSATSWSAPSASGR